MTDLRSPSEDRPYRPAAPQSYERPYTYDERGTGYGGKFQTLRQHRFFPLGSVLVAVIVFGAVISYAYKQGSHTGETATTPVVEASNTDYKTKPANPGGMDVPFQDAVVFDQLNGKQTAKDNTVESLLPASEQPAKTAATTTNTIAPADTTTTANASNTTAPPVTTTTATTTPDATTTTPSPSTEPATTTTPSTTAPTTAVQATPAKTNKVATKLASVAPAATTPAAKISSGSYRVQLGAFKDEGAAHAAWTKAKNQFSSQLGSVTPAFTRADLGAKGTFYRVQGTNLSKASADQICSSINAAKGGSCIVTK